MCTRYLFYLFFASFMVSSGMAFGQAGENPIGIAESIDKQFEEVLQNSRDYWDRQIIDDEALADLRTTIHFKVSELEGQLKTLDAKNAEQQQQLAEFKKALKKAKAQLKELQGNANTLSLFGLVNIPGVIIWIVVFALLILGLVYYYRYKNSFVVTAEAEAKLEEAEQEFELFRQKALETQQKLGRQLQDERNKHASGDTGEGQ